MKLTRVHMRQVRLLVDRLAASATPTSTTFRDQLKVVYLVRDPRGIYSSRRAMAWCSNSTCSSPATLCSEMAEDIAVFEELKMRQPHKFFVARYEDIALTPRAQSLELFHDLELPFSPSVSRFLRTHTAVSKNARDAHNPYATKRDSKSVAFEWRRTLKGDELAAVQTACAHVMRRLGYKVLPANGEPPLEAHGARPGAEILDDLPPQLTGK